MRLCREVLGTSSSVVQTVGSKGKEVTRETAYRGLQSVLSQLIVGCSEPRYYVVLLAFPTTSEDEASTVDDFVLPLPGLSP